MSFPYPILQLKNMGKGSDVHHGQALNSLSCLVKMIIWTCPVKDSHAEQVNQNQIVHLAPIDPSGSFCASDHVCPQSIVEEEVWVHVPLPLVLDDSLVVRC